MTNEESCENLLELREFLGTTGGLRESKKILRFQESCKNSCKLDFAGIYIYL